MKRPGSGIRSHKMSFCSNLMGESEGIDAVSSTCDFRPTVEGFGMTERLEKVRPVQGTHLKLMGQKLAGQFALHQLL